MPKWDEPEFTAVYPEDSDSVKSHIVRKGMTKEEVLSNLGSAPRKIIRVSDNEEIWVYGKYWRGDVQAKLTFVNGRIEKIEEFYLTNQSGQQ